MSVTYYFFKFCVKSTFVQEIIQRNTTDVIVIIPVKIKLFNLFLNSLVFTVLGIVQVENIDFSDQKGFDSCFVTLPCNNAVLVIVFVIA